MAGDKLVRIIQNAGKQDQALATNLLFGVVTSASPLKIRVDNRFEIDENFILLSALVKDTTVAINPHTHEIVGYPNTNPSMPTIKLWRGLQLGDKVIMLRVNDGQLFYVLQREGGVI